MKKRIITRILGTLALAGAGILALAGCGSKSGKTVITAETKGSISPFFITLDESEKDKALYKTKDNIYLTGYDVAVITEVFKLPELENYELDLRVSNNTITDAQQGIIDFAINNYSYNTDRAKSFYFSYAYTKSRYTITSKAGTSINSFEELAESGLKIYGGAGGNTTNAIERWNEARTSSQKKINIEYTSIDITAQIQEAVEGKTALIHDQPVILKYQESYPEAFKNLNITVLSDEETSANITAHNTSHLLFGKTGENAIKYRELLSNGIKTLYENGTLARLGEEYVGVNVLPLASDYEAYLD